MIENNRKKVTKNPSINGLSNQLADKVIRMTKKSGNGLPRNTLKDETGKLKSMMRGNVFFTRAKKTGV